MKRKYDIKIGEKYKLSMLDSQVPAYMTFLPGMYFSFEVGNEIFKFLILNKEDDYFWVERVE